MWSKKEKKRSKVTTTTHESHVSKTSQFLTVNNFTATQRTRSTSVHDPFPSSITFPSRFSIFDKTPTTFPLNGTKKFTSDINLDATGFAIPSNINPNHSSPYQRNSPGNRSFQIRSPVAASNGTQLGTGSTYRPALPTTVQPMPAKTTEPLSNEKLIVKKTNKLYDGPENKIPTYSTHSKNRGEVLIINNIMFKDKGYRYGARMDDKKLKDLFKQIGFSVHVKQNLKKDGMVSEVKNFSRKNSLKSADIAIVVIMTHGTKNETLGGTEVFGLDEKGVLVEDLMNFFNDKDCKNMANKPKIFIFQCCRGDNEHFIQSDAQRNVQPLADALIAYSSLPGFVSHRDPEHGTWYISTICDVFSQHAHEYHVEDLLKMVDVKLGAFNKQIRQTTHYENRGFKRCFLHPK